MTVEFMAEAEQELADAVCWYESKQSGLGRRFKAEVESVVGCVALNPLLQRERKGGCRRINCPVFPYYLPYFIRGDKIIIVAVAHERQKPRYYNQRQSDL